MNRMYISTSFLKNVQHSSQYIDMCTIFRLSKDLAVRPIQDLHVFDPRFIIMILTQAIDRKNKYTSRIFRFLLVLPLRLELVLNQR